MVISKNLTDKMKLVCKEYEPLQWKKIHAEKNVMHADTTCREYRSEPEDLIYKPISAGDRWGHDHTTTWFICDVETELENTWISFEFIGPGGRQDEQILIFANGKPIGSLDRNHFRTQLPGTGKFHIAMEAYPYHTMPGTQPHEKPREVKSLDRIFSGIFLSSERPAVRRFVMDMKILLELCDILPENDLFLYEIQKTMQEVFLAVDSIPDEKNEIRIQKQMEIAASLLRPLMEAKNPSFAPLAALVGHAHIDTAWLWDIAETTRKCARTFSNILALMRIDPDFYFVQSQPYQLEKMKEYPSIYEEVTRRIEEGRWEINGGMYVEPDLNLPSGEALVRQLLHGQLTTYEAFGKLSDTLWMPDTFGFSAAIPQLLAGAGIKYFSTGKLSGNDTTLFPYDAFRWKGIDGSEVVAHFHRIEAGPFPHVLCDLWNRVLNKDTQKTVFSAFGHGDGGGGPTIDMLESARRLKDLQGVPKAYHTTVSGFFGSLDADQLPVYDGELYFQMHRGTYTSISDIKKYNRILEFKFQETEYHLTRAAIEDGVPYPKEEMDSLWKRFLVCQFHDILPGTAIQEVNEQAVETLCDIRDKLDILMNKPAVDNKVVLHNYTGMDYKGVIDIPDNKEIPESGGMQRYLDIDGKKRVVLDEISIPSLSSAVIDTFEITENSPFRYSGNMLETPLMTVLFDESGCITSLIPQNGNEMVKDKFNTFWIGEDVPRMWDNWDIDIEQKLKMQEDFSLASREIITDGAVEFRLRSKYILGENVCPGQGSVLWQDMVFYAADMRVDFVSKLDWHGKRTLLKVGFDSTIRARESIHEIQFGHIARVNHENEKPDRAQFEVCNHKWTALSQADMGFSILNDCKYGVSVAGGDVRLTLLKSSVHPDTRGDQGVHYFTYSLLPHTGGFSVPETIRQAYMINAPLTVSGGKEVKPFISSSSPAVQIQAVKMAQQENGVVVRLSENAGGNAKTLLTANFPFAEVYETDLLERCGKELQKNHLELTFSPFEVKTVLFRL